VFVISGMHIFKRKTTTFHAHTLAIASLEVLSIHNRYTVNKTTLDRKVNFNRLIILQ
jgi:hypothetical protein